MKMTKQLLSAVAIGLASNGTLAASDLATVKGRWGVSMSAYFYLESTPATLVGRFSFDGAGKVNVALKGSTYGTVSSVTGTGTYTLAANCQGVMTVYSTGTPDRIDFVVTGMAGSPSMVFMVSNPEDAVTAHGAATKIQL